jgi:hypothetical protein
MTKVGKLTTLKNDDGNAIVEFIAVAIGIMIPIGYLVVALSDVLSAYAAAHSAAREASRVYVRDVAVSGGEFRARQAANIAFADRGLDLPVESVAFECSLGGCLEPGSRIRVVINWQMPLPWLPEPLSAIGYIPVSASQEFVVDSYRPAGV